jgi:hypothetical protein
MPTMESTKSFALFTQSFSDMSVVVRPRAL